LIGGAVIVVLLAAYLYGVVVFESHFQINTTIDGRNMSFLTATEAEAKLADNAANYTLAIVGREGLEVDLNATQLGVYYVPDGQLDALLAAQNPWAWPARLLPQPAQFTQSALAFNDQALDQALADSGIFDTSKMRPPADATAVFKDGSYVVQSEDLGTTIDPDKARAAIVEAIQSGQDTCDLELAQAYVAPTVVADSPELLTRISEFNTYANFEITYTFGDQTEVLDANTAIQWFDTNADGTMKLNVKKLEDWLVGFGKRHDTVGATRPFTTTNGQQIEVSGGSYGWAVDEQAERDAIIAAIANQTHETRDPIYIQTAVNHTLPDWGDTYVEVDQSVQHMWYYVDGQLVLDTDVVTGYPTPQRSTPNGVYWIFMKKSPAQLRGPLIGNDEYEWESTVQYWMQITRGGVGFHDAYWQSSFGLARWQAGYGSHGCINMPLDKAKQFYSMVQIGTPVIIHQ